MNDDLPVNPEDQNTEETVSSNEESVAENTAAESTDTAPEDHTQPEATDSATPTEETPAEEHSSAPEAPVVEATSPAVEESTSTPEPVEAVSEESTATPEPVATASEEKADATESLKAGESIHDDDDSSEDEALEEGEEDEEEINVEELGKQELLAFIERVLKEDKVIQRAKLVNQARNRYKELFEAERKKALEEFLAVEGNVEMDFEFPLAYIDRQWREASRQYGIRKKAIREAAEAERETNLKKKQALLEKLKELTERATDHDAFDLLKGIQEEWRNIGQVPAAELDSLNKNYRFLNDKFFDQRSLIREFQEYDRKKNLDTKMEIITAMSELADSKEENLKEMLKNHRQLLDSWRHTGPVPKENLDEVMTAFRAANDKITERKGALIEVLDGERKENQVKKEAIIESVVGLLDDENELSWSKRNKELGSLIEQWKKIGGVPRSENKRIRTEFTEAVKAFNKVKNTFFKEQKKQQAINVELREGAIAKVQAITNAGGELFKKRSEVIQIQQYWKTLGHIPKKQGDELWGRFRGACNEFFDAIKAGDNAKRAEQEANIKKKQEICEAIEKLAEQEDVDQDALTEFEAQWRSIGFVPISKKNEIDQRYRKAINSVLAQSVKMEDVPEHLVEYKLKIEGMMRSDSRQLSQELQTLRKRIQKENNELNTLETNIQFFSNSKGAEKLIAPVLTQIEGIKKVVNGLKEKEKLVKQSLNLLRD